MHIQLVCMYVACKRLLLMLLLLCVHLPAPAVRALGGTCLSVSLSHSLLELALACGGAARLLILGWAELGRLLSHTLLHTLCLSTATF